MPCVAVAHTSSKQPIAPYPSLPPNPPLKHLRLPSPNTTPNATAANKFDRSNMTMKILIAARRGWLSMREREVNKEKVKVDANKEKRRTSGSNGT